MCGAAISAESIAGVCAACPLYRIKSGCCIDLIACPECGYHSLPREHGPAAAGRPASSFETSVPPAATSPLAAADAPPGTAPSLTAVAARPEEVAERPASMRPAKCRSATRLSEVPAGSRARLLGFNGIDDNHLSRLTAYGLLPGVHVEVLQRFPAIILGVYQAELAIETTLAQGIWVLPVPQGR